MKSNKFRILTLAMVAVLTQSTCVYAASDKKEYTKDELNNSEPGFDWNDIDKNDQKVNSYINSYSSSITPKEAAENSESNSSSASTTTTTATNAADPAGAKNIITATQPSTGNKGDYWGKITGGKWMLIEQGVPATGWKMVKGIWYYMDLEGIMQTDWINDGENWYYLNSYGAMASNTYVGGYYLGWNGVMQ